MRQPPQEREPEERAAELMRQINQNFRPQTHVSDHGVNDAVAPPSHTQPGEYYDSLTGTWERESSPTAPDPPSEPSAEEPPVTASEDPPNPEVRVIFPDKEQSREPKPAPGPERWLVPDDPGHPIGQLDQPPGPDTASPPPDPGNNTYFDILTGKWKERPAPPETSPSTPRGPTNSPPPSSHEPEPDSASYPPSHGEENWDIPEPPTANPRRPHPPKPASPEPSPSTPRGRPDDPPRRGTVRPTARPRPSPRSPKHSRPSPAPVGGPGEHSGGHGSPDIDSVDTSRYSKVDLTKYWDPSKGAPSRSDVAKIRRAQKNVGRGFGGEVGVANLALYASDEAYAYGEDGISLLKYAIDFRSPPTGSSKDDVVSRALDELATNPSFADLSKPEVRKEAAQKLKADLEFAAQYVDGGEPDGGKELKKLYQAILDYRTLDDLHDEAVAAHIEPPSTLGSKARGFAKWLLAAPGTATAKVYTQAFTRLANRNRAVGPGHHEGVRKAARIVGGVGFVALGAAAGLKGADIILPDIGLSDAADFIGDVIDKVNPFDDDQQHSPTEPAQPPEGEGGQTEPPEPPAPAEPSTPAEPSPEPGGEPPANNGIGEAPGNESDNGPETGEAPGEPETIKREIGDWDASTGEGSVEGTVRDYATELGLDLNDSEIREAVEKALERDKVGGEDATMAERREAARQLQSDHKVTLSPDLFDLSASTETEPSQYLETDLAGEYLDENGNTHLNSTTHYQEGTPYNDIALKLHSEAAEKYRIEVDFSYLQKNNEYNHAYHNFVGNVLAENGLDWDSAKTDYHPGDTLRISEDSLKSFVEKVADLTGQEFNPDLDQPPTGPDQPEVPGEISEGGLQDTITERLDTSVSDLSDEQLQSLWAGTGVPPPESLSSGDISSLTDLSEYAPRDDQGNIHPQFIENLLDLLPDEPEVYDNGTVYPWQLWVATAAILAGGGGLAAWGGARAYKRIRNKRVARGTPPTATGGRQRPGRGRPPSAPRGRAPGRHRAPAGRRGSPAGP